MGGYVTLRDIAGEAGVSINTVSRALKDRDDIGVDTKLKIKAIAERLGYIPHAAASNLRSGGSKSIGVIVTHIDNAFFSRILQGVNDCVSASGYTVLTLSSNESCESELRYIKLLMAYRVSGILIVPACDLKSTVDYTSIQTPHIEIVRKGRQSAGNYFISNSRKSGELAAERMITLGRKRPAYLGFSMPVSCNRDRYKGYAERLKKSGQILDSSAVRHCQATSEAAFKEMSAWIGAGFPFDGLFAYNDAMAFGAMRALADAGIRIPDDVAVVGHDDVEVAQSFIPRLTTIQVPKYRLGLESARALLDVIEPNDEHPLTRRVIYEPDLVLRDS